MRVWIVGKRERRVCAVLLAVLLALAFALPWAAAQDRLLPVYRVKTDQPQIALTFDVAWEAGDLPDILQTLQKHGATATFFVTGDFARRLPEAVQAIHSAGQDIQNHSDTHPHVNRLSAEEIKTDAQKCDAQLQPLTGQLPKYYRAPYGEYNNTVISALEGYQVVQWDVDSLDWKPDTTAAQIVSNVQEKTQNGSILLFHVGSKAGQTATALDQLLSGFTGKFKPVLLPELLPQTGFKIDHKGEAQPVA